MVIKTASPGIVVTEVDLTRGNIDAITQNVGVIAGPFVKGPVDEFVLINTENDLLDIFGPPTDENHEYWWTVNNFLGYGGVSYVLRGDDSFGGNQTLRNATNGNSIYIKNDSHFNEVIHPSATDGQFIARTPGSWGNSIGVSVIDAGADYWANMNSTGVTKIANGEVIPGTFGGDFGNLVTGEVQNWRIDVTGVGFSVGERYEFPDIVRPNNPDGSSALPGNGLSMIVTDIDDEGPVGSISLAAAGAGYTTATDVPVTGGNGSGLRVNIQAEDTGRAEVLAIVTRSNSYGATLAAAGLDATSFSVPLTVANSPLNVYDPNRGSVASGVAIVGDFSNNRLSAIRLLAPGDGYKVGDLLDIVAITGPVGATTVVDTDIDTALRVTATSATGQIQSVSIGSTQGDLYSVGDVLTINLLGYTEAAFIIVTSTVADSSLIKVRMQNSGRDYLVGDKLTWTPVGGKVVLGTTSVTISNPGTSYSPGLYTNVPMWKLDGVTPVEMGAAAHVNVGPLGTVLDVEVVAGGRGWKVNDKVTFDPALIGGIATAEVLSIGTVTPGTGYGTGAWGQAAIPATVTPAGGTGATLSLTIVGGSVTTVAPKFGGIRYAVGNVVSFSNTNTNNVGSGFSVVVSSVDATGAITSFGTITPGILYPNGVYGGSPIPTTGGTGIGCGISFFASVPGAISNVKVLNRGAGYKVGDILTIDNAFTKGTGSGFKFPVTSVDVAGTGFAANVNDTDSLPATFTITDVAKNGEEIPSGFNIADYSSMLLDNISKEKLDWLLDPNNSARFFKVCDVNGVIDDPVDGARGHIFDYRISRVQRSSTNSNGITAESPLLAVRYMNTGTFEAAQNQYVIFPQDPTNAVHGPIRFVSPEIDHYCYDNNTLSQNIVNVVERRRQYSTRYAFDNFDWPRQPKGGARVTPAGTPIVTINSLDIGEEQDPTKKIGPTHLGQTFTFSAHLNAWLWTGERAAGDLYNDGSYVYRLRTTGAWYAQQEAFHNVPWSRFAPRPIATQFGVDRNTTNDALNIIVYDDTGSISGSKGTVLETYFGVSKLLGNKTPEGDDNYYMSVINSRSNYVYANKILPIGVYGRIPGNNVRPGTPAGSDQRVEFIDPTNFNLRRGVDNLNFDPADTDAAYQKIATESLEDIDYILSGPITPFLENPTANAVNDASVAKANFIIGIAEARQDCIAFISPPRSLIVGQKDTNRVTERIIDWARQIASSSYAVIDSGYKYMFDRFDTFSSSGIPGYRWVPLNGDIAGTMVYSSIVAQPWFSPAGMVRGQIRNTVSLPYNPSKPQRDELYTNRINPVVTFPGEGTVLFGDKTALGFSSAFDRINVRKLFLVLQRHIAKSARTNLFEFNDEITRTLFKNNVNPFLRDVQAKRGLFDFLVVCDETNNTPTVIDRNEFIADIYIKPNRSINFITLNFIATRTGITFDESIGLFRGSNNITSNT